MIVNDWLRPIYEGIPEILIGIPVRLASFGDILASGNKDTTGTLSDDEWVDKVEACPLASVARHSNGYVALISGHVSSDVWLAGCRHNTKWLTNIACYLVDQAQGEISRRASHLTSPYSLFLSHRSIDKPVVREIAQSIKRRGVGVWIDEEQLIPSRSLVTEISRALKSMTHFVLFWSVNCLNAPWVERELASAVSLLVENRIPLLIVRLDLTPVPPIVTDLLRIEAISQQAVETASQIVDTVKRLASSAAS
jgi:TIR domain